MKNLPQVALIGRTNVGKSTLFNRLIEENKALVSPEPGTTRDRNFGLVNWRGKIFTLVDTGGLDLGYLPKTKLPKKLKLTEKVSPDDLIETNIVKQAEIAIKTADFIILVVDGKSGLQPEDKTVTNILRKADKPYLLVVNKVDKIQQRNDIWEFNGLGLGDPIPVSAITGVGTGDLLDILIKKLKFKRIKPSQPKEEIKISIIGKPNVGKSSLLNAILGEERVIVSPLPHTTRESQTAEFEYQNYNFYLTDTAGIRRKSHVEPGLEKAGVTDSLLSLKRSDIALLVLECQNPLTAQDSKLAAEIIASHCGLIIIGNKWDLIENKETDTPDKFKDYFYNYFPSFTWAPVIFVSAKTGLRVNKILDLILEIRQARNKIVSDGELENLLKKSVKKHLPAKAKGLVHPYIYALKQTGTNPPRFQLLIHPKAELHYSYLHYLENQIRKTYGFAGTPIIVNQKFYKK
jgi:GTP-binding protein